MAVGTELQLHRDARAYEYLDKALRWFVVQLHLDHGWTARRIAEHLRGGNLRLIAESTVYRIVTYHRPDMYLDEMQELLSARTGREYPISTICTTLRRYNYTRSAACDFELERSLLDSNPSTTVPAAAHLP
ncbi:hypothetical protein M885DRAFT_572724 [Pelagophyceae sp. CCMP2097]|nr:hypothetical protein M885DRAFT_572724 [Pelagophyceae sp. CCMP2097]